MSQTLEDILDYHHAKRAWERVRRNRGAAGIDGLTVQQVDQAFPELWTAVADNILHQRFRPLPVRRVTIPKPDGGERHLGIPCVLDRVVSQLLHQMLSPLWEQEFSPMSFAYRPHRTPIQALKAACHQIDQGRPWLLHLDIREFFDSVPHALVLHLLHSKLEDIRITQLVERLLQTGICHPVLVTKTQAGLHQGSPLSPLLANVVLHQLDIWLHSQSQPFVRYADDILLFVNKAEQADPLRQQVEHQLAILGLHLNPQKTLSASANDSQFLGYSFQLGEEGKAQLLISPTSLKRIRDSLPMLIHTHSYQGAEGCARECARLLRSWQQHFGHSDDPRQLTELYQTAQALLCDAFPYQFPKQDPTTNITLQALGLSPHSPPPSQPCRVSYNGDLPLRTTDWRGSLQAWLKRLPRQRAVRLRVNFRRRRRHWFRPNSVSLVICGQEFRFNL